MSSELVESFRVGPYIYEVYNEKPNIEFFELKQIHSNKVLFADEIKLTEKSEGDGLFSKISHALGIKTADCLPIALIGNKGIANIHAGWRGLHKKIIENSELKKLDIYCAVIGPHISLKNYEVGHDFLDYFSEGIQTINNKFYLDLEKVARKQISQFFGKIDIKSSSHCTYDNNKLNSYRLNKTKKRNYNIIRKIEE